MKRQLVLCCAARLALVSGVASAFATGYPCVGGYLGGVLLGSYRYGAGRLMLNALRILEHVGRHPAAGRLLPNLARYAME